jgi:hypothetical protein
MTLHRRAHVIALVGILALATGLRVYGLSWGLRHTPHEDERYFVDNTRRMLAQGDFDHRFYEYPGLSFYILRTALAFLPDSAPRSTSYLAARGLVAAFGVLSVVLVYLLGRRMASPGVGLVAALFTAISPVAVQTAHMVRPDVVLESFCLAAFLVFLGVGPKLKYDLASGAALGAATAVKFSGVLLLPSYLVRRLMAPGPRFNRLLLAGLVSLAVFFVLTPYSIIHARKFFEGVSTQVTYHYVDQQGGSPSYAGLLWTYLAHPNGTLRKAFGIAGMVLAVLGLFSVRRDWREWLPLAIFPFVTVAVFSTAELHHDRFLVPALGVIAVFSAKGVEFIAKRRRQAAVVAILVATGLPLWTSLVYVRDVSLPGTRDLALDWVEANLSDGSRVLNGVKGMGFDRHRLEVLSTRGAFTQNQLLSAHVDLVVVTNPTPEDPFVGPLRRLYLAEPENPLAGPRIGLYVAPESYRPSYNRALIEPGWLAVSENQDRLPHLIDGRLATAWRTAGPQRPGSWVQVNFPAPVIVGRIELLLGNRPLRYAKNLHLRIAREESEWKRIGYVHGRPDVRRQVPGGEGSSEVLIFQPVRLQRFRIVQMGERFRPWAIAELRVDLLEEETYNLPP